MKALLAATALALGLVASPAAFADAKATCEKSAADKKLAGAAKDSHIKKCMSDAAGAAGGAQAACEKSAADKKLAGITILVLIAGYLIDISFCISVAVKNIDPDEYNLSQSSISLVLRLYWIFLCSFS